MAEPATLAVTGSRAGGADPRRSGAGPLRGDGPAHAVQRRDGGGGVRLEGSLRSAGLAGRRLGVDLHRDRGWGAGDRQRRRAPAHRAPGHRACVSCCPGRACSPGARAPRRSGRPSPLCREAAIALPSCQPICPSRPRRRGCGCGVPCPTTSTSTLPSIPTRGCTPTPPGAEVGGGEPRPVRCVPAPLGRPRLRVLDGRGPRVRGAPGGRGCPTGRGLPQPLLPVPPSGPRPRLRA